MNKKLTINDNSGNMHHQRERKARNFENIMMHVFVAYYIYERKKITQMFR